MPRNNLNQETAEAFVKIKLAIEKAKLAKLEAELPKPALNYTRYEDIPPPSPEERARFRERLDALIDKINTGEKERRREWYLSMVDKAP